MNCDCLKQFAHVRILFTPLRCRNPTCPSGGGLVKAIKINYLGLRSDRYELITCLENECIQWAYKLQEIHLRDHLGITDDETFHREMFDDAE